MLDTVALFCSFRGVPSVQTAGQITRDAPNTFEPYARSDHRLRTSFLLHMYTPIIC